MSLLDYFRLQRSRSLPNPRGPLSNKISSAAIASANSEVRAVLNGEPSGELSMNTGHSCKGKKPHAYSHKKRAEIGKLAGQVGPSEAAGRFSRKLGHPLNESTARRFKALCGKEKQKKRLIEE